MINPAAKRARNEAAGAEPVGAATLPFRTRSAPTAAPQEWAELDFISWTNTVCVARSEVARLASIDPQQAKKYPPELWRCDADGNPLPEGKVDVNGILMGRWTATMSPRPNELDILLLRDNNGPAPGAFVLFTLPPATPPVPAAQSAPLTSATGPDIAAFLRTTYPERKEISCPIKSIGAAFSLRGRGVAVTTLAGHIDARLALYEQARGAGISSSDQRLHKVAVAAAGPGTGKTRLLWDARRLLQEYYRSTEASRPQNDAMPELLERGIRLFTTYGNSSAPMNEERTLDTVVGGFAARLLHVHFCAERQRWDDFALFLARECFGLEVTVMFRQLELRTALRAIAHDLLPTSSLPPAGSLAAIYQFMLIELDEFTVIGSELLGRVMESVRVEMTTPSSLANGRRIFVQPMLGGTSMSAATSSLSPSGMLALPLAVPPLSMSDVLQILEEPGILPTAQRPLLQDRRFLELVADISGHPRLLDYLVKILQEHAKRSHAVTVDGVRILLENELHWLYHAVSCLSLDIAVNVFKAVIIGGAVDFEAYEDAEHRGLVLRLDHMAGATRLHMPLIFLDVWRTKWESDLAFASVKHLFGSGLRLELANVNTWQHFEIEVFRLEALRLACTTGTRRPLADLLRGALGDHRYIADWRTAVEPHDRTIVLPSRFPFGASVRQSYSGVVPAASDVGGIKLNTPATRLVDARRILMGLNADGAPFDQFSSCVEDEHGNQGMVCMQSKHTTNADGNKLTLAQVKAEYAKISEAMKDASLRAHFGCAAPQLPFVVLLHTVKPLAADITAETLPPRCFVVGRQQFADYFGSIFGARIEMVAQATEQ